MNQGSEQNLWFMVYILLPKMITGIYPQET